MHKQVSPFQMSFTQTLLHSVYNNWLPSRFQTSWHLASSSGNLISDSFKSTILCVGRSSIRSPSFQIFLTNNVTLRTKLSAFVFKHLSLVEQYPYFGNFYVFPSICDETEATTEIPFSIEPRIHWLYVVYVSIFF